MTTTITTSILIPAPAATVWNILTDFERFPDWNPFVRAISGRAIAGLHLTVKLQPDPQKKAMVFRPKVLVAVRNQELRWKGKLLIPGLFDGEHVFQLEQLTDGTTLFTHSERFTGLLIPFTRRMLHETTKTGFERMNEALRDRVLQQTAQVL